MWESGRRGKSLRPSVEEDGQRLGKSRGPESTGTGEMPEHLLLIQTAQREEGAGERRRAQVRSREPEELWMSTQSPRAAGSGEKRRSGGTGGWGGEGQKGGTSAGQGHEPEPAEEGMRSTAGRG